MADEFPSEKTPSRGQSATSASNKTNGGSGVWPPAAPATSSVNVKNDVMSEPKVKLDPMTFAEMRASAGQALRDLGAEIWSWRRVAAGAAVGLVALVFGGREYLKKYRPAPADWQSLTTEAVQPTIGTIRGSSSVGGTDQQTKAARVVEVERDYDRDVWVVKYKENGEYVVPQNLQLPPNYEIFDPSKPVEQAQPKEEAPEQEIKKRADPSSRKPLQEQKPQGPASQSVIARAQATAAGSKELG